MVTEANNGHGQFYGLYAYDLTAVGGTLYFDAIDTNPADAASADGVQLFESNGTAAGTMIVKDIPGANGYPGSYPADLAAAGGQLYFSATEGGYGSQLWTTNGTAAGTTMLTSGDAAGGGTAPQSLTAATGDVFFSGFDPDRQGPVVEEQRDRGRDGAADHRQRGDHGHEPAVPVGLGRARCTSRPTTVCTGPSSGRATARPARC